VIEGPGSEHLAVLAAIGYASIFIGLCGVSGAEIIGSGLVGTAYAIAAVPAAVKKLRKRLASWRRRPKPPQSPRPSWF
jgi:hypothetical protein